MARTRRDLARAAAALAWCACGGAVDQGLTTHDLDASAGDDATVDGGSVVDGAGGADVASDVSAADTGPPCVNLECQIAHCTPGSETSIGGTVYDPAGANPLYNVIVYVPNAPLAPLVDGVTCDKCGTPLTGSPLVAALTGADGTFMLKNVPAGADIPLVMQVGKWRRQIKIPTVPPCMPTTLTDKNLTRLPKQQSEGDLPRIAVVTGACDSSECLLRNVGIADSEFTAPTGNGRVHVFLGSGGASQIPGSTSVATDLWSSATQMAKYDMQIDACECSEVPAEKPQASIDNVVAYANAGGRLLLTHYQYYWIDPQIVSAGATDPWLGTAAFHAETSANTTVTTTIDTSFPKGAALADWLVTVGASTTRGSLVVNDARYNATDVVPPSLRWISAASPTSLMQYTFGAPIGTPADQQCGKVLFSDFHVAGNSNGMAFPQECAGNTLSAQQKAFEFMLFDLSSCIQDDRLAPRAPVLR